MHSKQTYIAKEKLSQEYGFPGLYCFWCGCSLRFDEATIDHLKPISRGGSNSLENLRLVCLKCNRVRGNSLFPPHWQPYNHP